MIGSSVTRLSLIAMLCTAIGVAGAWVSTGGAMFSPGALHAGDASREQYGGVTAHSELAGQCSACHALVGSARPMAVRCLECHTDTKRELDDSTSLHGALTSARDCLACHTEHHGPTASLTNTAGFRSAHDDLGFALTAHRTLANGDAFTCASCHVRTTHKVANTSCASCHRDYQAAFMQRHVAAWGTQCQSCHDGRDRFSKGRFTHDTTQYPLDGAHRRVTCAACHTKVTQLSGFATAPSACVSCHQADDKHRGELGTDCASCHTTASWEGATFEHTAFPIDHGESGRSTCKTCHQDAKNYKVYTCYGCHEHTPARVQAQHRGEVRTQNLDNCLECHEGGRGEGGERGEGRDRGGRTDRRERDH